MPMNRREMLKSSAIMMLGASMPAIAKSGGIWGTDGIGVQLYALDPDLRRDLHGTLDKVAKLGFRSVEIASMHGRTAAQMRAALDQAGLYCRSVHVAASSSVPGASGLTFDDMDKLGEDLTTLGAREAVLPLFQFPKDPKWGEPVPFSSLMRADGSPLSAARYEQMANFLNQAGSALKKHGLRVGYHNHNVEFAPIGEKTGLQILLERTNPRLVDFEMDVGWLVTAGHDPVAWLRKYPGRFNQMHVKDIKASTPVNFHLRQDPVEVGGGKIDWNSILPVARTSGVHRYFVEQDPPFTGPRIDAMARSLAYLRSLPIARGGH
ncbi:sugar phosphate isomerase/epimerase family protein [Sphingobium tyrosinilyticum]|uniref:Sugar phosphate isomerase/epimerase family protein n=1 Tax=Sphingobium tyrosinilyticum TaxID=2715436 RepID=A0ABV9F361_9SPHN